MFSYGDEITSTSNEREKFATYTRDSYTGLDYADQRYYASTYGRFNTPDPYKASGGPSDPSSWNRYSYTQGDPVNYLDQTGTNRSTTVTFTYLVPISNIVPGSEGELQGYSGFMRQTDVFDISDAPPADRLSNYSIKCQEAMKATGKNVSAIDRAYDAVDQLMAAAKGTNIDWTMLAAIGIRESGFLNVNQNGGKGVGVFQIDLGQNPSAAGQAGDLASAANWAATTLSSNNTRLASLYPNLDPAHLMQATAASWNLGVGGISGNPDTIDNGSAGGNYGSNIIGLMDCFH